MKKSRQGRTRELRERLKREREEQKKNQAERIVRECVDCKSQELVEDEHQGDTICTECGLVQPGSGLMIAMNELPSAKKYSKDYARKTHFEQKIKQLTIRDVKISKRVIKGVSKYCAANNLDVRNITKKQVSQIVQKIEDEKTGEKLYTKTDASKISRSILQIKNKLGVLDKDYCLDTLDEEIWDIMRMRFDMVSEEFDKLKKEGKIDRKNIITLNYLILKFLELEDPEYVSLFAKYIPQFKRKDSCKNKRKDNAPIFKKICKRLKTKFYINKKDGKLYLFNWKLSKQ